MDLTGKYIIAFDTLCTGWSSVKDEDGLPVLYESRDEAVKEMFDDALSSLMSRSREELEEYNEGVTFAMIKQMQKIYDAGNAPLMEKYLSDFPNCNDNNEFIVPAEEYIEGRKTILTHQGLVVTGIPAKDLFNK